MWTPALVKFYGKVCYYCESQFIEEQHRCFGYESPYKMVYDHLNDMNDDNRPANIVLAHNICNQRKKRSDQWKLKASIQLKQNEVDGIIDQLCENENRKNAIRDENTEDDKNREYNEELFSNPEFMKIAEEYILEKLSVAERIPYKTTRDSIAMKCFKIIGHCSPNTIDRAIDMLVSDEGKLYKFRDGGKQWISKKNPLMGI